MKDDRYVSIDIPPYVEPELYYKKNKTLSNRGYSTLIVLSIVTLILSIAIIVLGVYLGK